MGDILMLHDHTIYSVSDALGTPREHAEKYKALGRDFYLATEHGNLSSSYVTYRACKDLGLKHLIGMEAYVSIDNSRYYHQLLIVKNKNGYQNLLSLLKDARPVIGRRDGLVRSIIDLHELFKRGDGLIVGTACIGGLIQQVLLKEGPEQAQIWLDRFANRFKDDFYLEIQHSGIHEQIAVANYFLHSGIQYIITADSHYVEKKDKLYHNLLYSMKNKSVKIDGLPGTGSYHIKSDKELIADCDKIAVANSYKIVEQCNHGVVYGESNMPEWDLDSDPDRILREKTYIGFKAKYGNSKQSKERLESELEIISIMGFSSYFLNVWDIVSHAKEEGIMVGPGRGSGAGSIVAYCLNITEVDPIRFGLKFERFLNPGRAELISPEFK